MLNPGTAELRRGLSKPRHLAQETLAGRL